MKSNCLLGAMKQYIKHPLSTKIHMRGSWLEVFQFKWPHFYWLDLRDNNNYYHFCARYSDEPFVNQIWFQGEVKRFGWHGKSKRKEM